MATIWPREWTTPTGKERSGYEVTWTDEKGKRRRKLFSGDDAMLKATRLRGRIDAAAPEKRSTVKVDGDDPAFTTVRQAGSRWVRYVEREKGRERSTWGKYEQRLEDHICPATIKRVSGEEVCFGDLPVNGAGGVTAPDVEALKDHLLKKLSGDLAGTCLSVFRMMMNDVVRRGEREANPALAVRIRRQARGEDEVEIPQPEEMKAVVDAARGPPPAPLTLPEVWVGVTIFSGLRPSENRGLAIEDLVLDGPHPGIPVRRRADQWNKIGPVKSASGRRFVELPPQVIALLKRWLLVVPRGDGFDDPERKGRKLHPLFPTSTGTIQTLANLHHRMWMPLLTKAGLVDWEPVTEADGAPVLDKDGRHVLRPVGRYSVNCLRHFHASWLIDQGWLPKKVQKRMGHSSIVVTYDKYGHLFDRRENDTAAIARLEQSLWERK
jgi:integrase